MIDWATTVVTVIGTLLASSGFWAFTSRISDKKDARTQMLIGLGHDRIIYLGQSYINRGWITADEYENLYEYLYLPYRKCGGNGSAERIMEQVKKLPPQKAGCA